MSRILEVFRVFLILGLTSFGGPVAHLGYFRTAFVDRLRWLSDVEFADLVALCQFLPGPASSQVGIGIGLRRAGYPGAVAAWLAFTLPSALIMLAVAWGVDFIDGFWADAIVHGLKLAAVAVVAQAVYGMGRTLTPDLPRLALGAVALLTALLLPGALTPLLIMALAFATGLLLPVEDTARRGAPTGGWPSGLGWLIAFAVLLVGLPLADSATGQGWLDVVDRFYRAGSLVFGGGHVVLPLLEGELVAPGLVDRDTFLAGYGASQALPGPLFAFAAYAGAVLNVPPNGIAGGLLALVAIYIPSFLLVFGALPIWSRLRDRPRPRNALMLANAAVVGILAATLWDPVILSSITRVSDVAIALVALAALMAKVPPWVVVVGTVVLSVGIRLAGW